MVHGSVSCAGELGPSGLLIRNLRTPVNPPEPAAAPAPKTPTRRRRPTPVAVTTAYILGFGSVFALLALELFDLDGLLDHLPPGLLFFWMAGVAVSLALVAIDLVLTRLDRRALDHRDSGR